MSLYWTGDSVYFDSSQPHGMKALNGAGKIFGHNNIEFMLENTYKVNFDSLDDFRTNFKIKF